MIRRIALLCFAVLATVAFAQEDKDKDLTRANYKLEFVLKQIDHGKIVSTHNYVMSITVTGKNGNWSQIRTGDRIPTDLGGDKGVNYVDIGFNCDARVDRPAVDNKLSLAVNWDISTMPDTAGTDRNRIIRQTRGRSDPLVTLGKQTIVSSVDDLNSSQQFELDVTATPQI